MDSHGFGLNRLLRRIGWVWLAALLAAAVCLSAPEPKRPNIVLLVVHRLRPDYLGCYGHERPTSPNIDILAERSVLFETAITQTPWARGALASMFTSLYPFQHGVTGEESVMPESLVTLPEILKEQGYATMCVMSMTGLAETSGILAGFTKIVEPEEKQRNAKETTDIAIGLMERSSRPFFLMAGYNDTDSQYQTPSRFLEAVSLPGTPLRPATFLTCRPEELAEVPSRDYILQEMRFYDGCIRYIDEQIGRLVKSIEEMGIGQNTLLILTADQGRSFWEHGASYYGASVYDEAIRVPLIASYPGRFQNAKRVRSQVSHVDIAPTILALLGVKRSKGWEGTSLLPLIEGSKWPRRRDTFLPRGSALCENTGGGVPGTKCIRKEDWKLIIEPATSMVDLYDHQRDPGETVNLWDEGWGENNTIMAQMQRVPGVNLRGWRLAFTGGGAHVRFVADADLPEGGRLSCVEIFTRLQTLSLEISADSTSLHAETDPEGLDLLLFEVMPEDAPIRLRIESSGEDAPVYASVGKSSGVRIGVPFTLKPRDAAGLPADFEAARRAGAPGVHVWRLPSPNRQD